MLNIRFSRIGKKKQPSYRIIVLEKRRDPWGKFLEDLGYYNPFTKKKNLKKDRIQYWISKGAQPSDTVHNLLVGEKIISSSKIKKIRAKKSSSAEATEDKEKKGEAAEPAKEKQAVAEKPVAEKKEV